MTNTNYKIRLYVASPYEAGHEVDLEAGQAHYLSHVVRCKLGDNISVFNGRDGVWLANISHMAKKSVTICLQESLLSFTPSPDIWLGFAPIKNKTELVVEKATELGVTKFLPVIMSHSVVNKVNMDKLKARSIEAAEQCERHDVPRIEQASAINSLLENWPDDRILLYGDESGGGGSLAALLDNLPQGKYGLLIGPEGGFSKDEHEMLKKLSYVKPFGMGPRILKADTAAVSALACIMAQLGDWQKKPHFKAM